MAESESTQFFQFDKEGNMYVFAPGTGCTGPIRLVGPGDKLIFNGTYNPDDWALETKPQITYKDTGLLHTCPGGDVSTSSCEFKLPLLK